MANYVNGVGLHLFFILAVTLLSGLLFYAATPALQKKWIWAYGTSSI